MLSPKLRGERFTQVGELFELWITLDSQVEERREVVDWSRRFSCQAKSRADGVGVKGARLLGAPLVVGRGLDQQFKRERISLPPDGAPGSQDIRQLPDWTLLQLLNDDKVHIAVGIGSAASIGTEQDHLTRMKALHENAQVRQQLIRDSMDRIARIAQDLLAYRELRRAVLSCSHSWKVALNPTQRQCGWSGVG